MSIEALLAENTAALIANTEQLKLLNAGREDALAALTAKTDAPKGTGRGRKAAEPAATEQVATATASASTAETQSTMASTTTLAKSTVDVSDDAMRAFVSGWLKSTEDASEVAARGDQLKSILAHFGVSALVGEKGITGEDERRQALFFVTRFKEGLTVDFSADYDFDADPLTQGNTEPAPAAEDDLLG